MYLNLRGEPDGKKNRLLKLPKMVHISAIWWSKTSQSISLMQPDPEIWGLDYNSLYFENTTSNNNGI